MPSRPKRKTRPENILRDTSAPIYLLNADREIVFVNAACETLTGRAADQLVGLCCRYSGPAGTCDLPDVAASLAPPPGVMSGVPAVVLSQFIRSDGDRLWLQIHFLPCHDSTGALLAVVGFVSDRADALPPERDGPIEAHEALLRLRDQLHRRFAIGTMIASSISMRRVLDQIRVAAGCDASVFITGEPGTGKSLVARAIHGASARKSGPFLPIECGLLPADLTERDLLGDDRAHLGTARASDRGLLQRGRGGTIFLKDVAKLPRDVQSGIVKHLGTSFTEQADERAAAIRLIASETLDSERMLASQQIRLDFFHFISTIIIALPPLRDRKEELPLLAQWFVERINAGGAKQVSGLTATALEIMLGYDWPGNIEELADTIAAAHAHCTTNLITPNDLTPRIQGALGGAFAPPPADEPIDLDRLLAETERRLIEQAIKRARGNKSVAAELLSISRPRLYRRMQLLGIDGADESELPKSEWEQGDEPAQGASDG